MDENSEDENTDQLAQHLGRIFAAAVEGDECMQRVACEIGAVTSSSLHPSHKKLVTRLVTSLAPAKYTTLLKTFKTGATTARCDKHACALLHLQQTREMSVIWSNTEARKAGSVSRAVVSSSVKSSILKFKGHALKSSPNPVAAPITSKKVLRAFQWPHSPSNRDKALEGESI
ncbi:hypothetical protein E2C01_000655 [Portunus trituberculatus]|uniref:Uncharacterized protein n=1 Tax=Portunus trituberculatus TaxID=210409 RepID=A0A5B7CH56_PORTR|nr:hypothetical protein [Portunus trituberculatus]